jgi:hypothetical protein
MTDVPGQQRRAGRESSISDSPRGEKTFGENVDDASDASFPASDPPAWMGLRVGGPSTPDASRGSVEGELPG